MPDFTVAHKSLGQADSEGRGLELGVPLSLLGALGLELVHDGSVGGQDGIALLGRLLRRDAPPVDDDC